MINSVVIGKYEEKYFKKSAIQVSETESEGEFIDIESNDLDKSKIKVFDRFTIIL